MLIQSADRVYILSLFCLHCLPCNCKQEAAAAFAREIKLHPALSKKYDLVLPAAGLDGKRDQNSLVLLDRVRFPAAAATDVTANILSRIGGDWVAPGDLLVVVAADTEGTPLLLASFHGDSSGLSTQPAS